MAFEFKEISLIQGVNFSYDSFGKIFLILAVIILIFSVWMFVDMVKQTKGTNRGIWIILFLATGLLASIVWFFVRKK